MKIHLLAMLCVAWALVLKTNAATISLTNSDAFGATSFDTGLNWSDGLAPSVGNSYAVTNGLGLRTPAVAGNLLFAGDALLLGDNGSAGTMTYKGVGGADIITITNAIANRGIIGNGQGGNVTFSGLMTLGPGGLTLDHGGGGRTITMAAPIVGTGPLISANLSTNGAGGVILASNNTYEGYTLVATGTLQVGVGGPEGTLGLGDITNRGTLIFHRSDSYVVTNRIAGPLGAWWVRGGDMTFAGNSATTLQLHVPDAAGVTSPVTLNLSNAVVHVTANAFNNMNLGSVANPASSGTLNMNGGSLTVAHEFFIAGANGGNSRGFFNLYAGNVLVSNWTGIGRGGTPTSGVNNYGELNVYGGAWSNVAQNNITLASFAGNTGTVRVTGGRLYSQNGILVGESGGGTLYVGNTGVVDVNWMTLGDRNNGWGTAFITGGLVQVRSFLSVANAAGTAGTLNLGAGQLALNSLYRIGTTSSINLAGGIISPYNADATISAPLNLTTDTSFGGTGVVTIAAQTPAGGTNDLAITADMSGDGGLTKTGGGALYLGGLNVYTGPTTVEAGYLFGTGALFSAVTVNSNAVLGPRNLQYPNALFSLLTSVTMNPGARFSAGLNGTNASLMVYGALTGSGDHRLDLLPSGTGLTTGTHTLIKFGSLSSINFTTGHVPSGVEGYIDVTGLSVNYVVTNLTAAAQGFVWTGATDNKWDVNGTTNWRPSGAFTPAVFEDAYPALFDDTGTNTAVNIPSSITPGLVTVSNNLLAYSISGAGIGGPAGFVKQGTNTLVLTAPGTYSGTNRILAGTVVASNATSLGTTNGPTLINGGTLDVGGQNLGGEPVFLAGTGAGGNGAVINNGPALNNGLQYVTLIGDATIGGTNRWDIRNNNAFLDLAGYTLTKTGANYIALSSLFTMTNAGSVVIDGGTLGLEAAGSRFSGPGNIIVNPGGTLGLYQSPNVWKTNVYNGGTVLGVTGGGTNQIGAPVTINTNSTINTTAADITFTNVIAGPAGFTKAGANAVMLLATNSYAGTTTISAGSVMLGNGTDGNGSLGIGAVVNNSQLIFNRPDSHVVTNPISGSGQLLARRGNTTLLNTTVTNQRLYVMDTTIPSGNAVLNISNSFITITSNATRNFSVGLSTNPATTGIVNMVSGTIRATNECWVAAGGAGGSSRGIFNLLGGDVSVVSWTAIGRGDGGIGHYGELNISGGSWSNIGANHLSIASFASNTGRVTVTGGRLYTLNSLYVGEAGVGYLNVAGGTGDVNILSIGQNANGMGRVDISAGTLTTRNVLTAGNALGTVATIYQTGGSLTATASDSRLANVTNAYAFYRASGGSFTGAGNYQIGASGVGLMELHGTAAATSSGGFPVIGRFAGARGVLHVAGGSFTHNNSASFLIVGEQGYGNLNVMGSGTVTVHSSRTADGLRIAHNLGTGVVNLATGGTLVAPAVTRAAAAANIGVLNFNGGTLRANNNNAAFDANLSAINIYGGGAQIDDGGFTIVFTQALATAAGQGITSIPVLTAGDGFKGPPFVQILGGGSNATAIAQIDYVTGSLTNILVTSPGNSYTSFPAITLVGGAPVTPPTLGTPVFAANTSGGFTKLGGGTVTLTASNSYAGPTIVSNGTLTLSGTASIDNSTSIAVQTGATLNVATRSDGTLRVQAGQSLLGAGTINGNVTNLGTVAPGFAIGKLTVNSGYAQTGTLNIEIGGATTPGVDYDQLSVAGDVTFGGTLNVSFVNGYTGTPGDIFFVLAGSSGSGTFATTNLPALSAGRYWDLTYLGGAVAMLSITSAPAAMGYDLYASQVTNPADRGYQNDPDADGFANLLEYATGGNPTNADFVASMSGTRSNGLLAIRFTRNTNAVDTTIYVEGSGSSTNEATWTGLATNLGGSWGAATNVLESGGNPASVTAYDLNGTATNRFLRIRVSRP